ncbi:enhancer of mRNA decapping [Ciborinia camelliae]|nr:enhancer of mRNA decapping [Ciborinia camelliae]
MSNQFIGLTMLVTLSSPPGAQLRGIVSSIEPGKSLTLREVTCPSNGKYVPEFTINAAEITELIEAGNENVKAPPSVIQQKPVVVPASAAKKFEDPAILSMGKRPGSEVSPAVSVPSQSQWKSTPMERDDSARSAVGREDRRKEQNTSSALPDSLTSQEIHNQEEHEAEILEELDAELAGLSVEPAFAKSGRRTRRRKNQGKKPVEERAFQEPDVIPAKETTRSKGWRQTPLLEPVASFQPFATLRKKSQRRGNRNMEESGWATEEATDVQEMGDFDFAGSLAKFDKKTVFNQIQAEDGIAESDRLVGHNRLPKAKPGTYGGKNLHPAENVLDVPNGATKATETWKSDADDTDIQEKSSQRGSGSGRNSRTRRPESKLSIHHRPTSRKGSIAPSSQPSRNISVAPSKLMFYLVPSDRRCEPISALQMLNLENIADTELGLTEDMMTENAGRGIAEVGLSAVSTGNRGLTQGKKSTVPTVVVFAGNNKSGLRAVAAGRHLRNHGLNVVVCVLGLERDSELLVGLRRQIKVFRGFGGKVLTKSELLDFVKSLPVPIDLIIDGLLGLTMSFEELRTGDQATAYELIEWANRSKAPVLAIDVPTGIDPTSGKVSIIDGRKLYIHARYVVAMGAPKKGLLEAMSMGEGVGDEEKLGLGMTSGNAKASGEWQLFVADIGLGMAVWKKAGTRVRRGVEFEGSWVLGMRFQGGAGLE